MADQDPAVQELARQQLAAQDPAAQEPAAQELADQLPPARSPTDRPLTAMLLRGIREAQSMILVAILLLMDLPSLLGSLDRYPSPALAWLWFGLLVAVAAADVAIGARGRFWGRGAWPAAVLVQVVATAAAASLPAEDLLTPAMYTFGVAGWFGMLIFSDHRLRDVLGFIVVHLLATAALLAWHGLLAERLVTLLIVAIGVYSFQVALIAATLVLRGLADNATASAVARAGAATAEQVAHEVHTDRETRYAALRGSALPLLVGVGDGSLLPTDPEVRRRAAVEAARMRRLFGEQGDTATLLAAEVEALVEVVERRGVRVRYAARPVVVEPSPEVRRSLVEAVSGVLLVTARTARVTVGGTGSEVTVSVVTDGVLPRPDGSAPDGSAPDGSGGADTGPTDGSVVVDPGTGVRTTTVADDGRTWVEARWTVP